MGTRDHDAWGRTLRGLDARRRLPPALVFLALLLVAPTLFGFAYAVKLKDGSLVFARVPYTVKGMRAIITLENGIVTQIPLDQVDQPGTERYNRENIGNAIAIPTPRERTWQLPARPTRPLSTSSGSRQAVDRALRGGPTVRAVRQVAQGDGRPSASLSIP